MRTLVFTLFALLSSRLAAGETVAVDWRPEVYSSEGGEYLVRLDVPDYNAVADTLKVPVTILRFHPRTSSYRKQRSFMMRGSQFPQTVLISSDGSRIVAINYSMPRDGRSEVVQVYDAKGKMLREFVFEDIYSADDVASYWKHDDRAVGRWLDEPYITRDKRVVFVCRDVLGTERLHDYVLDLTTLKVSVVE